MRRVLLVVLVLSAGCSASDSAGIEIEDPWARPAPEGATTAAFFLTIESGSDIDETLVGASTDACRVTELHQSMTIDGVASMEQMAGGIEIPASETVTLEPGGLHIMCIDRSDGFIPDQEISLTLEFAADDGSRHSETVTAVVEDR